MNLLRRISLTVDNLVSPSFGLSMAPKCGSTSVDRWVVARNGLDKCNWDMYSTALAFGLRSWVDIELINFPIFAITRDPVSRMRSVIANRVYETGPRGVRTRIPRGLEPDEIVSRLDEFRFLCTDFYWHTRPQVEFIGFEPRRFQRVIDVNELSGLIFTLTGETLRVHNMSYSPLIEFSQESIAKIKEFYAADYQFIEMSREVPVYAM